MRELMDYLSKIPWESQGNDGIAWVNIDRIMEDTEMTREEIYMIASQAKPKGFIRWSFLGLQSNKFLSRLSISPAGKQWLKENEEFSAITKVSPEFLTISHPPYK